MNSASTPATTPVGEITGAVQAWKAGGRTAGSRQRLLRDLARLPGVYVPSCYEVAYDATQKVTRVAVLPDPRFPEAAEAHHDNAYAFNQRTGDRF